MSDNSDGSSISTTRSLKRSLSVSKKKKKSKLNQSFDVNFFQPDHSSIHERKSKSAKIEVSI
jgi:hypothetical protein